MKKFLVVFVMILAVSSIFASQEMQIDWAKLSPQFIVGGSNLFL